MKEPYHTQKATCKNCGHEIYYQFNRWEHYTRVYTSRFPYTTLKCFAPGDRPYGPIIEFPNKRRTACLCDKPEPLQETLGSVKK